MFGLAIWDHRTRMLLLARDRAGEKPLFYARVGHEILFASELQCILRHPDISREVEMVNLEIRGGKRRAEALRGLADRTGEPELSKQVAVMIQTDRFGTSIAESLLLVTSPVK